MADVAVILSGLLLAIPGLVSDLLAVLILITPLRRLAASLWAPHRGPRRFMPAHLEVEKTSSRGNFR